MSIVRAADGKKGESSPCFTINSLLKWCVWGCVCVCSLSRSGVALWLLRMLGVSQGNSCHGNGHQSVLCYHSSTTGGVGGGSDGPVTSGDKGGWKGEGNSERDRARLKGH